ncbi:MAG: hypothetical protein SCALA702_14740 [Melioribacteraceae bacterium]|nr:MAG: hypothetical protein SCALA702_14740 [Melioribacteraceae bacterium]
MKKFTIYSMLFMLMLSFSFVSAQDQSTYRKTPAKISSIEQMQQVKTNNDFDKNATRHEVTATEDQWDLLFAYDIETLTASVGNAGAETDGSHFYVTIWSSDQIHKLDMDGNYIESFAIAGVSGLRDLAYDGTYFYGGAASTTIYEMDFDNKTLVSSISTTASVRAIAYDSDLDGFWVNNWADDLSLVGRDGTVSQTFTGITSQYGMAYDNVSDGGPYIWCFTGTNGAPDPIYLEQFDIATGMYTGVAQDITADFGNGLAGGLFTYEADGLYIIGGLNQGEATLTPIVPNTLFGYELAQLVSYDHDMAVTGFVSPLTGYDLTATEVVEVKLKNKGTMDASGFMVSYSVDGGTPVDETYSGTVMAGEEVTYAFTATADLSGFGDYEIVATVMLTGDENPGNDSKSTMVTNSPAPSQIMAYPMNVDYWTGSTDGVTKTEVSLTHAVGGDEEGGWMIFDVSELPPGATVNWVDMSVYVYDANWPYWSITPMGVDPLTADAAAIYNEAAANSGTDVAYSYNNESSAFGPGWWTYTLGNSANEDLAAAAGGAFPVGVVSRDGTNTYYTKLEGQAETNVPYLLIDYNVPMEGDAGVTMLMLPGQATPGPIMPKAMVKNWSGSMMSFPVTLTIDGGYSSTMQVVDLPAGEEVEVTFDEWNAMIGTYTAEVCTEASGDPVPENNCMMKSVTISDLTQAYAYVAYDPTSTNPEGPATFFLQSPDAITSLAPTTSAQFIGAGAWGNGTWYAMEYFDGTSGGNLYTIDPNTGAMTAVGGSGVGINGIAYDGTTNTLFGIGGGMLYEIDMATGVATTVGATGSASLMIGLACSGDGTLYTYSLDDELFMVDKNTGAVTLIGAIGFDANYAQDMEFDLNTGTLYLAAYNNAGGGELRTADINTGATTLIGLFQGGSEICGFAIPGEAGPVSGFMADVSVYDAGGMALETGNTLTFGTADDATDGLDAQYNELELPPVPPAGVFDARFILPGGTTASLVDIRNTDNEEIIWKMNFQPGDQGYPFTFAWDPNDLPDGSFMLVDGVTGGMLLSVDMKMNDMYELTNSSITSLEIHYSEAMTMSFEMLAGWNIMSVPVMTPDMSVATMFPDATSDAFAFDNGYTAVTELEGGVGYWLKMPEAGTHEMTGMAMTANVAVNAGWNIIGPYHYEMDVTNVTTNPAGIITSDFFGFDAGYFSAEGLMPGHGYWVKASAAGEIVMSMAKKGEDTDAPAEDALYTISVATSDGAAGSYGLMLGIDPAATDGIDSDLGETELPPLPPAGVYDARMILADGTTGSPADYRMGDANFTGQITYTLKYQLGDGGASMTLDVDIPEIPGTVTMTVQDPFGGVLVNEVVNEGGGQVVVTNTSLTELKLIVDYNAPIPVELSSFAANVVGETIQLAWETATETNNKGFEVERSEDGQTFTKIGYIDGNGTSSEKHAYNFTDHHATVGSYFYRLRQVDFDGTAHYSDAVEVDFVPTEFSLGQNYPNPFNPSTKIKFAVPVDSKITVTLYNMLGQKVKELVSQDYSVGLHEVELNASELASGMYIYSITAQGVDGSNFVDTKKMMLMK